MVLQSILPRRLTSLGRAALGLVLLGACGGSDGGTGPEPKAAATLSGTVRAAGTSAVLANAQVMIGTKQVTSDASGNFDFADLPVGAATVRAERPGYLPAEAALTLNAGANSHHFSLTVQEIYISGTTAMYVPAGVGPLRGVVIALGGPNTTGFVTGGRIAPLDEPDLELSMQQLGASLRALATTSRVALFGSATPGMANSSGSDITLFGAISNFAALSDHSELAAAPVLLFGTSGGGPEAAGLVSRHPERAIGLIERKPSSVTSLTAAAALAVPTFVMQAGADVVVGNSAVRSTFLENRSRGGLWSLVVEPGVGHYESTTLSNAAATGWMSMVLTARLPATAGAALTALDESSGWLGNQATLEVAAWAAYPDDRTTASWLLSQPAATVWRTLGGGVGSGSPGRGEPPPASR